MQVRCPHCFVPFESADDMSWSDVSCPSCGGNFTLSGVETTCTYGPGVRVLGRFELLEEVGAGRFGSVWKARDTELQRLVAVKIPRQRALDPHETEMFLRDARAAAQLRHPRIASVHEVGRENETVYIVTDYIDGANLNEWLSGQCLTSREAAELMIKIAEAAHHAHEKGVVHRDLKPSNIMLDRHGEPYVIDFGLARRDIGEMTVTVEGQVLGTPAYMPPEQARGEGHQADRRSDTYSLGVILFQLLTGDLPFRGQPRVLIFQILDKEPPNPRTLNVRVPRDLATVTLKCLEKDPARRYPTARELADDLRRFLAGEPIQARAVSPVERTWRWCKRHPDVAALAAMLWLVLLAAAIVAPIVALHQARLRREAERQVADNLFQRASEEYHAGRVMKGIALLSGANELVEAESPLSGSIRSLLSGWDRHGWRPIVHDHTVLATAISPNGRVALIGGHDRKRPARFWDVETLAPIGAPLEHDGSVRAVAFSRDGNIALTGSADGTARLWDVRSGRVKSPSLPHSGQSQVWAVAISPDGDTIATGGRDKMARLWDAETGEPRGRPLEHNDTVLAVTFRPDGRTLVTGSWDGTARLWDVETAHPRGPPIQIGTPVYAVDFSPDGSRIVTGSGDGTVRLWNAETTESISDPVIHAELMYADRQPVYAAVFSQDGCRVLSGSFDHTARLWDVQKQPLQPVGEPLRHGGWVMSVAFGPGGHTAITGSADRTARLWRIHDGRTLPHDGPTHATAFSPDGRSVLIGGDRTVRHWDVGTGEPIGKPWELDGTVMAVAFNPAGSKVLTGSDDRQVRCWSANTGEQFTNQQPWELSGTVQDIRFCEDGTNVLLSCASDNSQMVQLWEFSTGKPLSDPVQLDTSEKVVASSPDGHTLLVLGAAGSTVQLVDVPSGTIKGESLPHDDVQSIDAVFSGDGRMVVTGAYDQKVRLWNAQTGELIGEPFSHDGIVNTIALGSDGRTILSGSDDKTARLWDAQTMMSLGPPLQHPKPVWKVALGPERDRHCCLALTICSDGSARLWDVPSGKPLARPLEYETAVEDGMFNSDGSAILFQCKDGTVRIYDAPQPLRGDAEVIRAWARARTGFELDGRGTLRQLSQQEWLDAQSEWVQLPTNDGTLEKAHSSSPNPRAGLSRGATQLQNK